MSSLETQQDHQDTKALRESALKDLKSDCHLGRHIVAEFFEADKENLNDGKQLNQEMVNAAGVSGATVLSSDWHFFEPHGVSVVTIIAESNLCIHTWPEHGYAAADFFTCGDDVNPWKSFEYLKNYLKAKKYNVMELQRGSTSMIKNPEKIQNNVESRTLENGKDDVKTGDKLDPWPEENNVVTRELYKGEERCVIHELEAHAETRTLTTGTELLKKKNQFQRMNVIQNKWWGKILYLDNVVNVAEHDEFIYHEMLIHVPMMTHPAPKRVLIVGGGDGGSAREVMKHDDVDECVMIDIDEDVVKACREFMPSVSGGAFEDPRLKLIIGDGIQYVKDCADEQFDVIIVDSTDPFDENPGNELFTEEFYKHCQRALKPNGVLSSQSMMPIRDPAALYLRSINNLQKGFGLDRTYLYLLSLDSFRGTVTFGLTFKGDSHPEKIDKARCNAFAKAKNLKYYSHGIHLASFALPPYLKKMIGVDQD